MASTSAQSPVRPLVERGLNGLLRAAEALRTPRTGEDELAEARELLGYWERRAHGLPRWALVRRREARDMCRRWRARVREAEQARYGRGIPGAASQLAIERRVPVGVAHRGRQAARVALGAAVTVTLTLLLVLAAAVAMIAETVLGAL